MKPYDFIIIGTLREVLVLLVTIVLLKYSENLIIIFMNLRSGKICGKQMRWDSSSKNDCDHDLSGDGDSCATSTRAASTRISSTNSNRAASTDSKRAISAPINPIRVTSTISSVTSTCNDDTRLICHKNVSKIGTWNVRSLMKTGKISLLCRELKKYNIDVAAITETWLCNDGDKRINVGSDVFRLLHSSAARLPGKNRPYAGVGLMLNQRAMNSLIGHTFINERLMTAHFRCQIGILSIVIAYAPTEDKCSKVKDSFYDSLQKVLDDIPSKNFLVLAGDFNAKVGKSIIPSVIGNFGVDSDISDNGHQLIDFAAYNGLSVMNTMFRHKRAHKFTWNNPDRLHKSMIDYILVRQRWRTSVQDTRVYRGADIGSDHHLLVSTFRLKFKTTRAGSKPPVRLDSSKPGNSSTRKYY